MLNSLKYSTIGLALFCMGSCSSPNQQTDKPQRVVVDMKAPVISDSTMKQLFHHGQFVTLKGVMLGRIDKLVEWHGRYVVLDKKGQQAVVFDSTGNCLFQIRQLGKGPREYIQLGDCTVDLVSDELILYADQPGKLLFYDRNGTFLREEDRRGCFFEFGLTGEVLVGVNCRNPGAAGDFLTLIGSEKTNRTVCSALPYGIWTTSLSTGRQMFCTQKEMWFAEPMGDRLFRFDGATMDKPVAIYELDFGSGNMPPDFVTPKSDASDLYAKAKRDGVVLQISDLCWAKHRLLFKTNLGQIFVWDSVGGEVRQFGNLTLPNCKAVRLSGYLPLEGETERIACEITAENLIRWRNMMQNKMIGEDQEILRLANENEEWQNPTLLIYDVE